MQEVERKHYLSYEIMVVRPEMDGNVSCEFLNKVVIATCRSESQYKIIFLVSAF